LVEIVLRPRDPAAEAGEIGHAPAEGDSLQLELFGQLAALLVEPPSQPRAAHFGIDAHLVAVEPAARGIVAAAEAVAGDLVPAMRGERLLPRDAHRGAIADHLVVEHRDEAALGEVVDLAAN